MRLGAILLLLLIAVAAVSLVEGLPDDLPGVSLGSSVLLHIERIAAMFAIGVAVISVLREAWRGRLPTQLTTAGLSYEAESAAEAKAAVEDLQRQLDDLSQRVLAMVQHARVDPRSQE